MQMMASPELVILDVGHGGCAILRDANSVVIIDCPPSATLMETLDHFKIREISSMLISHADSDHIGGLTSLISNRKIRIHNLFLNPDALKETEVWEDLRFVVRDARKRGLIKVHTMLTTEQTGQIDTGQVKIEILAPSPELAMSGAGGRDLQGKRLSSNSMSVVVGLIHNAHRVAMLPGDIDDVGFKNFVDDHTDLRADILVFPHHGGRAGKADGEAFAYAFCNLVKPKLVLFSFDRNQSQNPREEIVKGIRSAVPHAHFICTQLSKICAEHVPEADLDHLFQLPAKGRASKSCCGGSIIISLNGEDTVGAFSFEKHSIFVKNEVPTPLCLRSLS
jgi:beta-lactamase superfamily II metal-dependent hydrolase